MSEDVKDSRKQKKEEVLMPDFSDLWKEMYFRMEETWANAVKEVISTKTFVDYLDKVLEYNLSSEKVLRQSLDRYAESVPIPTKKDISRLAELIISMEEKVDNLEFQLVQNIETMADSLLKMVKVQEKMQEEIINIREDINSVKLKIAGLEKGEELKDEKKAKSSRKSEKENKDEDN